MFQIWIIVQIIKFFILAKEQNLIYDISPVSNHQGNGSTINFDFNFYIDNVTQIKVYHFDENKIKRELVYELDYSISNVQNQNGGYSTG